MFFDSFYFTVVFNKGLLSVVWSFVSRSVLATNLYCAPPHAIFPSLRSCFIVLLVELKHLRLLLLSEGSVPLTYSHGCSQEILKGANGTEKLLSGGGQGGFSDNHKCHVLQCSTDVLCQSSAQGEGGGWDERCILLQYYIVLLINLDPRRGWPLRSPPPSWLRPCCALITWSKDVWMVMHGWWYLDGDVWMVMFGWWC